MPLTPATQREQSRLQRSEEHRTLVKTLPTEGIGHSVHDQSIFKVFRVRQDQSLGVESVAPAPLNQAETNS